MPRMPPFLPYSPVTYRVTDLLITCVWITIYLPLNCIILYRWLAQRPEWPEWTWGRYSMINRSRVRSTMQFWRRLPPRDPCEQSLPQDRYQWYARRFQCTIDQIECPPLPPAFPRLGPLAIARERVDDRTRTLFIVTAIASIVDANQSALSNERGILYIVGGGYIGGHPLSIHTPYSLANITGARVFCE